jgi:hypothetical protein
MSLAQELDLSACTALSEDALHIVATLTNLISLTASRLSTPDGTAYAYDSPGMAALFSSLTGALPPFTNRPALQTLCCQHDKSARRPLCCRPASIGAARMPDSLCRAAQCGGWPHRPHAAQSGYGSSCSTAYPGREHSPMHYELPVSSCWLAFLQSAMAPITCLG